MLKKIIAVMAAALTVGCTNVLNANALSEIDWLGLEEQLTEERIKPMSFFSSARYCRYQIHGICNKS